MLAHLAICDGDEGIPLWELVPTTDNITYNVMIGWLEPHEPCVVLMESTDGTCLVVFDGIVAYAVTACLYEIG